MEAWVENGLLARAFGLDFQEVLACLLIPSEFSVRQASGHLFQSLDPVIAYNMTATLRRESGVK